MIKKSRILATLIGTTLLLPATITHPTTAAETQARGTLTLFAEPNFTGSTLRIIYADCVPATSRTLNLKVASADNRPAPGCRVLLLPARPLSPPHLLCAGRSLIPEPYRTSPTIRIEPGPTPLCPNKRG